MTSPPENGCTPAGEGGRGISRSQENLPAPAGRLLSTTLTTGCTDATNTMIRTPPVNSTIPRSTEGFVQTDPPATVRYALPEASDSAIIEQGSVLLSNAVDRISSIPVTASTGKLPNVRRIIERERHIPKIEKIPVKRIIEIPELKIITKTVEVPRIKEIVQTVPVKQVVEVIREHYTQVPRLEVRKIEKEIEVLGEVVEVPKPFLIENRVVVPRFVDTPVPTVVTQTLTPVFVESDEHVVEICLKEYEPEVIPISIFLPRPVDRNVAVTGGVTRTHTPVEIPLAHYNSLLMKLNTPTSTTGSFKKTTPDRPAASTDTLHRTSSTLVISDTGSDDATTDDELAVDPSQWVHHMLIPTAVGAVPLLGHEVEIVTPVADDWMESYDETREYISKTSLPDMGSSMGRALTGACSKCVYRPKAQERRQDRRQKQQFDPEHQGNKKN